MSIIYEVITPNSESDSNYESFEFLVEWYGRNNQYIQYLFTDWNNRVRVRSEILNRDISNLIKGIINEENRSYEFTAEDLSLNDLRVFLSILVTPEINRLSKNGTRERLAVDNNSPFSYVENDGRYNFTFTLVPYNKPIKS